MQVFYKNVWSEVWLGVKDFVKIAFIIVISILIPIGLLGIFFKFIA